MPAQLTVPAKISLGLSDLIQAVRRSYPRDVEALLIHCMAELDDSTILAVREELADMANDGARQRVAFLDDLMELRKRHPSLLTRFRAIASESPK
jgi:hypothetical protein